jgi:hypothetical protein
MARRLVSRLAVILALPTVAGTFQLLAADCRQVQGTIVLPFVAGSYLHDGHNQR